MSILLWKLPIKGAVVWSVLLASLLALTGAASAEQAPATMRVSVVVPPRVTLSSQTPARLEITAQDVARGYVEVSALSEIVVRSNGGFDVVLEVRVPRGLFTGVRINGDTQADLPGEGGPVVLRWSAPSSGWIRKLRWSYRFSLEPALTAGQYDWPVLLAGQPLLASNQ